jgi:hypothetical protein
LNNRIRKYKGGTVPLDPSHWGAWPSRPKCPGQSGSGKVARPTWAFRPEAKAGSFSSSARWWLCRSISADRRRAAREEGVGDLAYAEGNPIVGVGWGVSHRSGQVVIGDTLWVEGGQCGCAVKGGRTIAVIDNWLAKEEPDGTAACSQ